MEEGGEKENLALNEITRKKSDLSGSYSRCGIYCSKMKVGVASKRRHVL